MTVHQIDDKTLFMHGEDDQIVPISVSWRKSVKLIKGAAELYYPGLPHGLTGCESVDDQIRLPEFRLAE